MEISKTFLNNMLENEEYEKILENNLHSGTHYSVIFPMKAKLYKAYYIEDHSGNPRWLSAPRSSAAECTEVEKVEETRVVVGYIDIDDGPPLVTPTCLDYRL